MTPDILRKCFWTRQQKYTMYAKQLESETQSVLKEGGDTQTSRKVDKFGKQPQLKISNCTDFEKTSCRNSLQIKSDILREMCTNQT